MGPQSTSQADGPWANGPQMTGPQTTTPQTMGPQTAGSQTTQPQMNGVPPPPPPATGSMAGAQNPQVPQVVTVIDLTTEASGPLDHAVLRDPEHRRQQTGYQAPEVTMRRPWLGEVSLGAILALSEQDYQLAINAPARHHLRGVEYAHDSDFEAFRATR